MRHQVDHRKLGRTASHRKALLRNLVTSLIEKERIETTLEKAKELRRLADRMVTLAKRGTIHARRQAGAVLYDKKTVQKLFAELAPRFETRQGGYTRIYKLGFRRGDAAEMALIEYLGYQAPKKEENKPGVKKNSKAASKKEKVKKEKISEEKKASQETTEEKISRKKPLKKTSSKATASKEEKSGNKEKTTRKKWFGRQKKGA